MALVERSVRELLNAFSSSDPTPGGGSASALASSVGVSLLMMVAGLPKTKHNSDDDRAALSGASAALDPLRGQLADAIDDDAAAYDGVVAAYKLPRGTDEEKHTRTDAIQRALKAATEVPLGVMRRSAAALHTAQVVAVHGHPGASSDVGVAMALLRAGLEGARLNVDINLESIADAAYVAEVRGEVERLTSASPAA